MKEFIAEQTNSFDLVFTDHGYENGDLCVETLKNPDGEALQIEYTLTNEIEISLSAGCKDNPLNLPLSPFSLNSTIKIYIDSCYSGKSIERAKRYLACYAIYGHRVIKYLLHPTHNAQVLILPLEASHFKVAVLVFSRRLGTKTRVQGKLSFRTTLVHHYRQNPIADFK